MKFENQTPLLTTMLRGEPEPDLMLATVIVKVAYTFDGAGGLSRLPAQAVEIREEPVPTALGFVPADNVPYRPGVNIYVLGHAHAPQGRPTQAMAVELRVASVRRQLLVVGDRVWTRAGIPTSPTAFIEMPLTYARAYGGKTLQHDQEVAYPDNPDGRGFVLDLASAEGTSLPNVEAPDDRVTTWQSRPKIGGWAPVPAQTAIHLRRSVQIIDPIRHEYRFLPGAFDVAHPDLVLPTLPRGSTIELLGMSRRGELSIPVPRLPLRLDVTLGPKSFSMDLELDTLGLHVLQNRLEATFRTSFRYRIIARQERRATLEIPETMPNEHL